MVSVDEIFGYIVDNIVELVCKFGLSIVVEGVEI